MNYFSCRYFFLSGSILENKWHALIFWIISFFPETDLNETVICQCNDIILYKLDTAAKALGRPELPPPSSDTQLNKRFTICSAATGSHTWPP